ncbi:patatin-like phospholipase family protein [Streptomyces sp. PKU-MA01144]|uniref:patatin-like phospholipase family protein n=1 Tax=Streptomyces TaxID=1883 RepID=UPI000381D854|nr:MULTISPECIES: patatin-like phospholipase family protein [Streptomyces]MCY0979599.1 patatin-like phospholipase family protein [Streptomyces tirandamycinicus]NNJ04602.1 patatin-like phospholipase family protein [Streptomyces sp. PKU-MA01144]
MADMDHAGVDTGTDGDGPSGHRGTALVLGGGGLAGIGWEVGILHGLAEAGADVSGADLIVGTSAGSVVGAQLSSGLLTLPELYERQLADPEGEVPAGMGPTVLARYVWGVLRSRDAEAYGARMGRLALSARTEPEEARRAVFAARLLTHDWPPARRLVVTAVDAVTGRLRAFDRSSGVGLLDAVGASCAVPGVWPPVTIDGRRFIDGGVRSSTNADLAAGYGTVVIVAPISVGGGPVPSARAQASRLAAAGARVVLITPDRAARRAFGRNVLDPARRAPSARAGRAQAVAHADAVRAVLPV